MNTLLIILILILYIAVGLALSVLADAKNPAIVTLLWLPIVFLEFCVELITLLLKKMGGK